jgi:lipopolysaccharide transport system ATP-binding protein
MTAQMEHILAFSELGEFLDQPVKTYSSGMYSRLAFAIAIHVDPDILIVDEALAVGDARFVAKCMRRIKDIQKKGATILFVSHDVTSVRTLCEKAIWLDKGRLQEYGEVFPVTGRYMELMFKDEESVDLSSHQKTVSQQDADPVLSDACQSQNEVQIGQDPDVLSVVAPMVNVTQNIMPGMRPVTHWGSHKGIILGASIRDKHGSRMDVFPWGDWIEIIIDLSIPKTISREYLSVAFSIKDLKGTDLIVSTTQDFTKQRLPDKEQFSVSFQLTNPLVTGKYLLVAAVENRQHHGTHYYEYVEGAHYFSSISNERFFGIFQPTIKQHVWMK